MANGKQATVKRMNMALRAEQLMQVHFPNVLPIWKWHRKTNDGYTTIPRTLPIAMQAIDAQSKGQPAGHTLFCLWSRAPDHQVVMIENPSTYANEAGFSGERAVDTWRKRMKRLKELGFIDAKPGSSGDFHYVFLINPNSTMEYMREHNCIQDGIYGRFVDRLMEIGAYGELEAARSYFREQAAIRATETAAAGPQEATTTQSDQPITVEPRNHKPKRANKHAKEKS